MLYLLLYFRNLFTAKNARILVSEMDLGLGVDARGRGRGRRTRGAAPLVRALRAGRLFGLEPRLRLRVVLRRARLNLRLRLFEARPPLLAPPQPLRNVPALGRLRFP